MQCECVEYDPIFHQFYVKDHPAEHVYEKIRRTRCRSCKKVIKKDDLCYVSARYRVPKNDIEERIYGSEIRLADWYLCEGCGDIYLNLTDIGYCIDIGKNMKNELAEYWKITGFKPLEVKNE